jgi:hypothetical protein
VGQPQIVDQIVAEVELREIGAPVQAGQSPIAGRPANEFESLQPRQSTGLRYRFISVRLEDDNGIDVTEVVDSQ